MFIDILKNAENSAKEVKTIITYKADGNGVKVVNGIKNRASQKRNIDYIRQMEAFIRLQKLSLILHVI